MLLLQVLEGEDGSRAAGSAGRAGSRGHHAPVPQALAMAAWAVGRRQIQPTPLARLGMAECSSGTEAQVPAGSSPAGGG